ncbi:MAG: hypothetical protein A2Y38_12665 [Spirochaetes bacterium GWB1_59_5]|nr:MAG: hypothetical protein A2Y38_12665 [Spirochaetes bacterium GWB1_59_5]
MKIAVFRITLACLAFSLTAAPAVGLPKGATFTAEGPDYIAEASGKGLTEAEAQNDALRTAIGVIMESLNKDRLFSELLLKNPPVTMDWKKLTSEKGVSSWTVSLRLVVDDESLRLLYNTAYVSTVSTMLDGAETRLSDAERLSLDAREAETDGALGRAMSLYWQARDAADSGLELLAPIGDAAVFSTFGKKKAPELREVLSAIRTTVVSGYDRIRAAEQGLAADDELASSLAALVKIETDLAAADAWANGISSKAAKVEGTPKAELRAFSDELAVKYRALSDSRLALGRVEDTVPRSKEIVTARIDVVRRRIDGLTDYFKKTKSAVDREIRDPAIARAKRSQNVRWAFLHEPSGALSLSLYTPFGLDPASNDIRFSDTDLFEFSIGSEQAFGGERGVWIASSLEKDDTMLAAPALAGDTVKNTGYTQFVDLGFYGRALWGVGFRWDWLRQVDGKTVEKRIAYRTFLGGVDSSSHRASWLLALSWEPPYELGDFELANSLNVGLDAHARLGTAVELDAGLALRPRKSVLGHDSSLEYSIGAGVRLPKPFLWGLEYSGYVVSSFEDEASRRTGAFVRMYLEYSL